METNLAFNWGIYLAITVPIWCALFTRVTKKYSSKHSAIYRYVCLYSWNQCPPSHKL